MHCIQHPNDEDNILFGGKSIVAVNAMPCTLMWCVGMDSRLQLSLLFTINAMVLTYEWTHVMAHCPKINARRSIFHTAIAGHRRHHEQNPTKSMGVSSALADKLFNTYQ